ncbi:MAG: HEAT repeat domain-containing protein [Myxococcota bacterium]
MVDNVCPTCGSSIDPARAPVAQIRGTAVVTYCSTACAAGEAEPAPASAERSRGRKGGAAGGPDQPGADGSPGGDRPGRAATAAVGDQASDARAVTTERPGKGARSNRKGQIIALSAAIMLGGMAITIINAVSPSSPSDVSAASSTGGAAERPTATADSSAAEPAPADEAAATQEPAERAPATPEQLNERAQDILRQLLQSPSPRVQRIAALALSRLADQAALDLLRNVLERSDSKLVRLEAAYALARIGDSDGRKHLREKLRHERRDVRVDAARYLAQLGDDSGLKSLRRMMSLRSHRLGAAEYLARRGDRDGIAELRGVLADDDSSEEFRMRALVALGRSGDTAVRDQLHAILQDGRYQVGAADALAALGDPLAIPQLRKQLGIASLRVRAALALRRLGAEADLDAVAAALDQGSEQARVTAAEAILILTGPKELAEYD